MNISLFACNYGHFAISFFFAPGRCAVSYMLSLSDNVTSLLPFVEPRNQREHDNKLAKSNMSSRYTAILLLQLLQCEWMDCVDFFDVIQILFFRFFAHIGQVHGGFLILYGNRLLNVAEFFKGISSMVYALRVLPRKIWVVARLYIAKTVPKCIKYSISALLFAVSSGKIDRVVVKMAEWWLGPTTPDQCGQNPASFQIIKCA